MTTPHIREATLADEPDVARICRLTGDAGGDATGNFGDDTALADVYATPYLHGPGCVALVVDVGGRAAGYVVAATDTRAFQEWFTEQWWPGRAALHPGRTSADEWLLASARDPQRCLNSAVDAYPAHLHIDLLPELQGAGWGRRLMDALRERLAAAGVAGVHLVAERRNAGAQAFYPRVGFVVADSDAGVTWACPIPAS